MFVVWYNFIMSLSSSNLVLKIKLIYCKKITKQKESKRNLQEKEWWYRWPEDARQGEARIPVTYEYGLEKVKPII